MSNEFPQGWATTTLDDACSVITDGTHQTPEYVSDGVPFISTTNLCPFKPGFDFSEYRRFISKNEHAELTKRCRPQKGDILVSKCGTIGRVKEVDVDFPFSIFVGLALLKLHRGIFSPKFGEFWLNSPEVTKQFEELAPGSTRKTLTIKGIKSVEIPIPPFNEQQRIVVKLEKLLGKMDTSQKRLVKISVLLKRFRQSVLVAACSGRLTADWRAKGATSEKAAVFLEEIRSNRNEKDKGSKLKVFDFEPEHLSQFPEIPELWLWQSVSACVDVRDGTHDSPKYHETGIPLVTSKNLLESGVDFSNVKLISTNDFESIAKRSSVEDGDILFAMIGTIGNATIVNGGHPFAIKNVGLFRTAGNLLLAKYLQYWLNSPYIILFLNDQAKGSSQPFAPLNLLRKLPVPIPPQGECEEIVRRIESLFKLADQIEARYTKAQSQVDKLTQSILAKAFRGELVPHDPNDEPASVLLERIKEKRK